MKKHLLSLALIAAFSAHATKPTPEPKTPAPTTPAGSNATAGAAAAAQARATARVSTRVASSASVATGAVVASPAGGSVDMAGASIGNAERSAPSVYGTATPPAADTCARPGLSIGGSSAGGGGLLNIPTGESGKCDVRSDALNMRYTGQPADVIKARYCMDQQLAEAYARAGQPCRDARPQAGAQGEPAPVVYARREVEAP